MSRRALAVIAVGIAAVVGGVTAAAQERGAQVPGLSPLPPAAPEESRRGQPQRPGELDCRGCHQGKHQGVLRMYLGLGGHGTPMIPSHMFQVRVECVACHIAPKEFEASLKVVAVAGRALLGCLGRERAAS